MVQRYLKPITRARGLRSPLPPNAILAGAKTVQTGTQFRQMGKRLVVTPAGQVNTEMDFSSITGAITIAADGTASTVGASGTFISGDAVPKTVTVVNGLITAIV